MLQVRLPQMGSDGLTDELACLAYAVMLRGQGCHQLVCFAFLVVAIEHDSVDGGLPMLVQMLEDTLESRDQGRQGVGMVYASVLGCVSQALDDLLGAGWAWSGGPTPARSAHGSHSAMGANARSISRNQTTTR